MINQSTNNNSDLRALEAFVLDNPDLENLEAELAHFNIFEAVGMVSQETRHSHFLAFLLDPAENHGLGDIFLKRILMRTLSQAANPPFSLIDIDVSDLSSATVKTEWEHIDISIVDETNRLVVAIENKIFSDEHGGQLKTYFDVVQRNYPEAQYKQVFIFLTNETKPSNNNYLVLSYGAIADTLVGIRRTYDSTIGTEVSILIEHYVTMLRRHIMDNSELADLCNKIWIKHRRALEILIEHSPMSKLREAISLYVNLLIENSQLFEKDDSSNMYIRFVPSNWDNIPALHSGSGWTKSNRILLFQFDNTPNDLSLTLYLGPGSEQVRDLLLGVAKQHTVIFKGMSTRPQTWKYLYTVNMLGRESILSAMSIDGLKPKIDEAWHKFIAEDLPAMSDILEHRVPWAEVEAQVKPTTNN